MTSKPELNMKSALIIKVGDFRNSEELVAESKKGEVRLRKR